MNAADRRTEIVSILVVSGHITARELAQEKLKEMYDTAEGENKKILERVLRKYGAYKLKL